MKNLQIIPIHFLSFLNGKWKTDKQNGRSKDIDFWLAVNGGIGVDMYVYILCI